MASVSREALDRKGGQDAGQGKPRQRPPGGDRVESQMPGETGVHLDLNRVDELEKRPGRQRDKQSDHRRKHEENAVLPAPDQ